jgi:hypothetical protein
VKTKASYKNVIVSYIETALWSSVAYDQEGNNGEPLDSNHDIHDLAYSTKLRMGKDVLGFLAHCRENHAEALDKYLQVHDYEQFAHDFWLTRNGHGAGFWDRGLGEAGEELSKAAKCWGSADLYIGDDGKIYHY